MVYTETEVPLTEGDRRRLTILRVRLFAGAVFFVLLVAAALYFFGFRKAESGPPVIVLGVFSVFFLTVAVFVVWIINSRFTRDLKSGMKKRVRGTVTDKQREMHGSQKGKNASRHYYLLFDNLKVPVDKKVYDAIHRGADIELDQSMYSGLIFSYTVLQEPAITQLKEEKTMKSVLPDEKETLLTDGDIDVLQQNKKRAMRRWIIRSLLWLFSFALLYIILIFSVALKVAQPLLPVLAIWFGVPALFILFRVMMYRRHVRSIAGDISRGRKIVRRQLINEKIASNVKMHGPNSYSNFAGEYYYIISGKRFIEVSAASFNEVRENADAFLHIAPLSGLILKIEHAKH